MRGLTRRLVVGCACLAVALAALAATPAEARHFGRSGFGYPVYYAPPVYPVYLPAPIYSVYAPPPVVYHYGDRYRVHRYHHRVVHRRWCGCKGCR